MNVPREPRGVEHEERLPSPALFTDGQQEIGTGTHERVLIEMKRFAAALARWGKAGRGARES